MSTVDGCIVRGYQVCYVHSIMHDTMTLYSDTLRSPGLDDAAADRDEDLNE